jgi:hypothetical protein
MVFAIAAIACDALVAVMAYADWRSFDAAPKSAFLAREAPSFAITGFAYALSSLLRYVVLSGLVVALLRFRAGGHRKNGGEAGPAEFRLRFPIAWAVVAVEVLYVAVVWTRPNPDGAWCLVRVTTSVVSAVVGALIITTLRSAIRSRGGRSVNVALGRA